MLDQWIVERIDVDGHAGAMLRQPPHPRSWAEIEGRRVVGTHGGFIVGIVFVYQDHALNGVLGAMQLTENSQQIIGYVLVADEFALQFLSFLIIMQHLQVTQIFPRRSTILLERFPFDTGKNTVRYLLLTEALGMDSKAYQAENEDYDS